LAAAVIIITVRTMQITVTITLGTIARLFITSQWETENHYDHKDFKMRSKDEQKQYFDWRHNHQDDKDKH
jgi:hypothetical protein